MIGSCDVKTIQNMSYLDILYKCATQPHMGKEDEGQQQAKNQPKRQKQ
jgi:hypothetical protein